MITDYPLAKFYADPLFQGHHHPSGRIWSVMERALQALVLSQYRLKVFQDYRLSIKPVVLFKAAEDRREQGVF